MSERMCPTSKSSKEDGRIYLRVNVGGQRNGVVMNSDEGVESDIKSYSCPVLMYELVLVDDSPDCSGKDEYDYDSCM